MKTRITFPSTSLPVVGGATVTLFNSVTAMGPKVLPHHDQHWFMYNIAPPANTTGNTVTGEYSNDGGTTWVQFYSSPGGEPVGDSTLFRDEVYIGDFQDVRFRFVNGASPQTTLPMNLWLDCNKNSSGL